jgi:hypothetical protein
MTTDFAKFGQWSGILTLVCLVITIIAFVLQWGMRFRFVGITGFMAVLTGGLFALGLGLFTRTVVPGAVRSALVYDNGRNQAVISLPPTVTPSEVEATLRQAADDLFSLGRGGVGGDNQLTVRARTIIHPQPGISKPLYLGQAKRALKSRDDEQIKIEIFSRNFSQLPK